jgi:hypothetical protein
MARRLITVMRDHAEEEKVSQDKDVYKNNIFDKVQMWLKEYDEKDMNSEERTFS